MEDKRGHLYFELSEELLSYGKDRNYPKNSMIYRQDEPAEEVFYLKEGKIRLAFYSEDGKRRIVFYSKKGSIFGGEIPIILSKPVYAINAEAIIDCLVIVFSKDVFFNLLMKNLDFVKLCLYWTSRKIWAMGEQVVSTSFLSSDKRIAYTLLCLTEHFASEGFNTDYKFRMTQEELAEVANVHRVTVANTLQCFNRAGIIDQKYGTIFITPEGRKKLKYFISKP